MAYAEKFTGKSFDQQLKEAEEQVNKYKTAYLERIRKERDINSKEYTRKVNIQNFLDSLQRHVYEKRYNDRKDFSDRWHLFNTEELFEEWYNRRSTFDEIVDQVSGKQKEELTNLLLPFDTL